MLVYQRVIQTDMVTQAGSPAVGFPCTRPHGCLVDTVVVVGLEVVLRRSRLVKSQKNISDHVTDYPCLLHVEIAIDFTIWL